MTSSLLGCTAGLAIATLVMAVPATAADAPRSHVVTTDAATLLAFALEVEQRGDLPKAETVYQALEQDRDSDVRAEANFRLARMAIAQRRWSEAAIRLRRILGDKPGAATVRLMLAQSLAEMGHEGAALRELRAAQAGGLPADLARFVDRYSAALRAARPAGASVEIALAPDSNINRATRSDTLGTVLGDFDIEDSGQAKSGVGLALRGSAFRRVALGTGGTNLVLRANGFADLFAKPQFNDVGAELAAGPELRLGSNRVTIEAAVGNRWFGQEPFLRSARLTTSLARPLAPTTQVRIGTSIALTDNRQNDLQDGTSVSGQASIERALSPVLGVALTASADRFSARDPGFSTKSWRAGVAAWRDIGRATVSASAELGRLRADERLTLFPERRLDRFSRLTIAALVRNLSAGGFSPSVRLVFERNESSIQFYDYARRRSEFAIVRAF